LNPKAEGARCDECPLAQAIFTPSTGNPNAKVAVVSRSPGYYESKHGEHFAGPSGKVLNHLLEQNGVKREEAFLTNVVLCESKAPPLAAIKACSPRLDRELRNADTIICAGSEAAKEVARINSLSGNRGFAHERRTSDSRRQRVVITNNPAIVLKDDSTFPNLVRDFKLALNPLPPPRMPEVHWTNDISEAKLWVEQIIRQERLFCDIETRGLAHTASLASIGISASGLKALAFGEQVLKDEDFVRHFLRRILELESSTYIWHNGKFDVRNLRAKGIKARVDHDTLLLSYALDERSDEDQVHSLDYLAMNELNWPQYEPQSVKNWKAKVGRLERELRFDELEALETPEELYEYNAYDAAATALLYPILSDRAHADGVWNYYTDFLLRDSNALIDVELRGMHYDIQRAAEINENEVLPRLNELREEMRWIVGDGAYNPNSSKQNAELVYDKWRIIHNIDRGEDKERSVDKAVYTEIKEGRFFVSTMGNPNTDQFGLSQGATDDEEISDELYRELIGESDYTGTDNGYPMGHSSEVRETATRWAERFAEFKELDKQRSTYIEGLIGRAETSGGKIYTDIKLHSTVTGRSSSSRPNMQNITRTKHGLPNIRSLFIASPGCTIVNVDYSQAELRAIAQLSGDSRLLDIYRHGQSLHQRVAERFYGKDYTGEQYVNAKNMDFGVAYGQSAQTFQEKHNVPVAEGEEFIKWWFREFPDVKRWRQHVARTVLKDGFIQSPFGHKRRFHLVTHENRGSVIREAINFLPQNIAARLTLWAMSELVELGFPVVNEVHDSIILDVPTSTLDETCHAVVGVMEKAPAVINWDIPFTAEIKVGKSWGEVD
jgi:uracil-DNA glycosylase family 4